MSPVQQCEKFRTVWHFNAFYKDVRLVARSNRLADKACMTHSNPLSLFDFPISGFLFGAIIVM